MAVVVIATLTIISFIYWGAGTSRMGGGGGAGRGDYGSIYGHKVTEQAFHEAANELFLLYWFQLANGPTTIPISMKPRCNGKFISGSC